MENLENLDKTLIERMSVRLWYRRTDISKEMAWKYNAQMRDGTLTMRQKLKIAEQLGYEICVRIP
ncbi:MAG: hypothetical protein LBB41_07340 [Prevotellaceae bacterium]|jgi:hypothetical protein|nr:hypothetical protein [Prevotellaceae bacterium]